METYLCPQCGTTILIYPGDESICTTCLMRGIVPLLRERRTEEEKLISSVFPDLMDIEAIGTGGMSMVYRAYDQKKKRFVALKIGKEIKAKDLLSELFDKELQTLSELNHPNILRVFQGDSLPDGRPYLITEYLDGETLDVRLKKGPLKEAEIIEIVRQICDGLDYAHQHRFVHRDIKPSNIMLTKDGVRVLDFGMAVRDQWAESLHGGRALGSPYYVAPEQRDGKEVDCRADLYSLGVLLYEMLVGNLPSVGSFVSPSKKRPGIARGWDGVVKKLLQESPEDRFASADQALAALERKVARKSASKARKLAVVGLGCLTLVGGAWKFRDVILPGTGTPLSRPGDATRAMPFVNSLGMKLVPVPESKLLFAIWETRVCDYRSFIQATSHDTKTSASGNVPKGVITVQEDGWRHHHGYDWNNPGFLQTDDHAVCGVSLEDARAFCEWLTAKEHRAGILRARWRYRLPTDLEWSQAAGVEGEQGKTPKERAFSAPMLTYAWGQRWPPPPNSANFAGKEFLEFRAPPKADILRDYEDAFQRTAPVDAFPPNKHGLHQMAGNVEEWCEELWAADDPHHVLRGGSWISTLQEAASLNYRGRDMADVRTTSRGFRIVLENR